MSTEGMVIAGREQIEVTSEQMSLARNTVAKGLDDEQFSLFVYNCKRQGIHPLDGLLVPIVRNDNEAGGKRLTFVTTVDLLRSRAAETNEYAGSDDAEFQYAQGAKNPQEAKVTVWRFVQNEKCSFTATARWEEYYPGEKQGFMWRNKPHVMLGKCAEALALRKAFPKQLAGLYISEELQRETTATNRQSQPKKQQAPVGQVMCGECRQFGGHHKLCKYAPKQGNAAATVVQETQTEAKATETTPTPESAFIRLLCKIEGVQVRTKEPLRILSVVADDGTKLISCWHKSLIPILDEHLKVCPVMAVLEVSQKQTEKSGVLYRSLEHVIELGAQKFVDDKPVVEGELHAGDLGFDPTEV